MPALVPSRTPRLVTVAVGFAAALLVTAAVAAPLPALAADAWTTTAAPTPTAAVPDRLTSGGTLTSGRSLRPVGSAHVLTVRADGDVTLSLGDRVLWHTGTTGNPGARLVQQPAGALEVRGATGTLLWSTATVSTGARTVVKPDGVLYTISTSHAVAWKSTVPGATLRTVGTDRLPSGGLLLPGESVTSPDGSTQLLMRADGDLTVSAGGRVVWRTGTAVRGARAVVTAGGDLRVVGPDGTALWSSGTASPGARLVVKDHGRAYLVSTTHAAVWSTPADAVAPAARVPAVVTLPLPSPLPTPLPTTPTPTPTASSPFAPVGPGALLGGATLASGSGSGSTTDGGAATEAVTSRPPTVLTGAPQYADPSSAAARAAAAARADGRVADAALLEKAATRGTARWLGPADGAATVRSYVTAAGAAGRTPVLVVYAIPDRDCGNHSAGGFTTHAGYRAWIDSVASGLRGGPTAVVVVEPDALLHLERCGDREERLAALSHATATLAGAGAEVYLDAASSNSFGWGETALREIAQRLRAAGVDRAAGFAVNTSNFQPDAHEVAYGRYLSALLGGARFVVDTSRNGNGALAGPEGTVWCNPPGRALGSPPAATVDGPHVANLWVKTPGLSDGTCHGGPPAGQLWEQYLLGLASAARW